MADGGSHLPSNPKRPEAQASGLLGVGIEFLSAILLLGALGYWLDGKFNLSPWLMVTGGVLGFAVGLYRLLQVSNRVNR
jgi:F0F1-type ATP synthase assembly protein I